MLIEFELNGKKCKTEADPSTRLIDFLREEMGLTGAKEGCGEGECLSLIHISSPRRPRRG